MFNFNGENDMKKPLYDEVDRYIIRNKIESSVYQNYLITHAMRGLERAIICTIKKDIHGVLNTLSKLNERIKK